MTTKSGTSRERQIALQIVSPDVQPGLSVKTKSQSLVRIIPEVEVRVPGMNSASESSLSLDTSFEITLHSGNLRRWDRKTRTIRQ